MKLNYIDSLRGWAVLGVIMVHTSFVGKYDLFPIKTMKVFENGDRGVQLFYIASAFTLFLSMKNRNESSFFNFFIRRFFRIAPMYYLCIIYYLLEDGFGPRYWLGDQKVISIGNIISNFTFTHGFNPYWLNSLVPGGWSIAVEMFFYLFVPFLFRRINNINKAFYFVLFSLVLRYILCLFFSKFTFISSDMLWQSYLYFYFPNQLPIFALGILLYFMVFEYNKCIIIKPLIYYIVSFVILFQINGFHILPLHFIYAVGFAFLVYALSKYEVKIIVNKISIYVGKISYSMYLLHIAVIYWLKKINFISFFPDKTLSYQLMNYVLLYLIIIFFSVILSTISYLFVEIHTQNWGKKYIN